MIYLSDLENRNVMHNVKPEEEIQNGVQGNTAVTMDRRKDIG